MTEMLLEIDGAEPEKDKILKIIFKYIELLKDTLSDSGKNLSFESFITSTTLVANDFFDGNLSRCSQDKKILLKDFGTPTILFNDLKNSTKLLEEIEHSNIDCLYVAYMYYSSQMIADILDLFGGVMVECTGDGNYSIFTEDRIDIKSIDKLGKDFLKNYNEEISLHAQQEYMSNFDDSELEGIDRVYSVFNHQCLQEVFKSAVCSSCIRRLFFRIFLMFNVEINKIASGYINNKFLTRVGCKKGACKITRIQIDNHIKQDKLIGSVVHHAAHQASGK